MIINISQPYCFSQLGRRDNQEDNLAPPTSDTDNRFFIVCDGVGGADRGEVASQLVCQSLEFNLANLYSDKGTVDVNDIVTAVDNAYETLYNNRAICASMATTMTLMAITDDGILLAHLGDSRIYQVRRGQGIIFRTKDHSYVQELVDKGEITETDAKYHPRRNAITKCLYVTDDPGRYFTPSVCIIRDIEPDDVFMLCSDGVYSVFDDTELGELLAADKPLADKATEIAAISKHSDDNNTAYLIEITSIDRQRDEVGNNVAYDIQPKKTGFFHSLLKLINLD